MKLLTSDIHVYVKSCLFIFIYPAAQDVKSVVSQLEFLETCLFTVEVSYCVQWSNMENPVTISLSVDDSDLHKSIIIRCYSLFIFILSLQQFVFESHKNKFTQQNTNICSKYWPNKRWTFLNFTQFFKDYIRELMSIITE